MRFNKTLGMLAVLAGFNTVAQAEEQVAAEKKAPSMETLVKPSTANLQYRQYFTDIRENDESTRVTSMNQIRTNLGFSLLNDKVNSTVILAASRNANEANFKQRRPQVVSMMNLAEKGPNALAAYLDLYLPQKGSGTEGHLGLEHTLGTTISEGSLGKLALDVTGDFDAIFSSKKNLKAKYSATAEQSESLGLTPVDAEKNAYEGLQSDPTLEADVETLVKYTPKVLPALTIGAGIEYDRVWAPTYEVNTDGTSSLTYAPETQTINRLQIAYKISDSTSLKNETYHYFNDFYASRMDGANGGYGRVFNYTTLNYTMF